MSKSMELLSISVANVIWRGSSHNVCSGLVLASPMRDEYLEMPVLRH